jgi:uncharacterized membrane protein
MVASTYLLVFRVVHILAAIAWGGAVFMMVVYLQPTAAAIAPAGTPFMTELLGRRKLVNGILAVAATSIVGGAFLYWHDWQATGSFGDWISSPFGGWMTIGAAAAILAFLIGLFVTRPNVGRMLALGAQIAQAGGAPAPEQAAQMQAIQARMKNAARTSFALIVVAAFAMSTARYW